MAQIIDTYDWTSEAASGSRTRLPWGEWLDGRIRVLTKGTDFNGQAENMKVQLRAQAKSRGRVALVKVDANEATSGPVTITVQAVNSDNTAIETPSVVEPAKKVKPVAATPAVEAAADATDGADASE